MSEIADDSGDDYQPPININEDDAESDESSSTKNEENGNARLVGK